jgi:AAA+ superfamily predicted ATPase
MNAINAILTAFMIGVAAALTTPRWVDDLTIHEGKCRTNGEAFRRECQKQGLLLLEISARKGCTANLDGLSPEDTATVQGVLQKAGLLEAPPKEALFKHLAVKIDTLLRGTIEAEWLDGQPLRFCALWRNADLHLPRADASLMDTSQLEQFEIFLSLAQSLSMKMKEHKIVLEAKENALNPDVSRLLYHVPMPYPDEKEKELFFRTVMPLLPHAHLEQGVEVSEAAHISSYTPNLLTLDLLRGSDSQHTPVTRAQLRQNKEQGIKQVSEDTLRLLDTSKAAQSDLRGRYLAPVKRVLLRLAEELRKGNTNVPLLVVLVGAPGTGKTNFVTMAASSAGVPAFEALSTKAGIVGETERKTLLQYDILRTIHPSICFRDEIAEALPTQRSDFDGDSGATRAVIAELLKMFSDPRLKGRCLQIGVTNCPWLIGKSMGTRMIFIPVFFPSEEDYPQILACQLEAIQPDFKARRERLAEAAQTFYAKGASPRAMKIALELASVEQGKLTEALVLKTAQNCLTQSSWAEIKYTDLWALKVCSKKEFLPWHEDPSYPLPEHFKGIVNPENGDIDYQRLNQAIEELKPYVNV